MFSGINLALTRKNCFRYLKLMSPLNAVICTTIIQEQNMNLKFNMKDINKILAKAHFKLKIKKK